MVEPRLTSERVAWSGRPAASAAACACSSSAPSQSGSRSNRADLPKTGSEEALTTVLDVIEMETKQIGAIGGSSGSAAPPTFRRAIPSTPSTAHACPAPGQKLQELSRGDFVDHADNVLLFGLPGVGKSHLACALGHALVDAGTERALHADLPAGAAASGRTRDLSLPRALRALDVFDAIDPRRPGYVQQTADEAEVLFTLMAERYERRSLIITSNLVFSEWDRIFKTPMTTAAAIDRLVHHATILEINVPSFRTARVRKKGDKTPDPPNTEAHL